MVTRICIFVAIAIFVRYQGYVCDNIAMNEVTRLCVCGN